MELFYFPDYVAMDAAGKFFQETMEFHIHMYTCTVKFLKNGTPKRISVIVMKMEQCDFTMQ